MSVKDYLYLPPHLNVLAGRTVTRTAGTVDSDHPVSRLTDERSAYPVRFNAGTWAVSISVDTDDIQFVALANHSLDGNVTVGGASGTIDPDLAFENGIYANPYLLRPTVAPNVTALTLSGSNTVPTIISEAFAGVPLEIPAFQLADMTDEFFDGKDQMPDGEFLNIPVHDDGLEWRVFGGTQIYTKAQADVLLAARRAQRGWSRPGVLVVDRELNDARVVMISRPVMKAVAGPDRYQMKVTFLELPRYRWPA